MLKKTILSLFLFYYTLFSADCATFKNDYYVIEINLKDSTVIFDNERYELAETKKETQHRDYTLYKYFCISEDLRMCVLFVYRYKNGYKIMMKKYNN